MRRRRPRIGKTGCLFWLFIVLVIAVVLIYRGRGSLRDTFSSLFTFNPRESDEVGLLRQPAEEAKPAEPSGGDTQPEPARPDDTEGGGGERTGDVPYESAGEGAEASGQPDREATEERTPRDQEVARGAGEPSGKIKRKDLNTAVYFISIDQSTGNVKPFPVVKTIQYLDSPITRTINTLLEGPSDSDRRRGATTFIPEETRLISAHIEGGHLTLNFSGQFESNYRGRQAVNFQLAQVILTAFEFDQVDSVSIFIEGTHKPYITGDGIPLKKRYTQDDLPIITSG
jgi:spore germination protein GerM